MANVPTERIRNVALLGHGGAGKTSVAEALLYVAGTISRVGRVEDGNTVCDFDPEEHKRQISVSLALAPFEWERPQGQPHRHARLRRLRRRRRRGAACRRPRDLRGVRGRGRGGADRDRLAHGRGRRDPRAVFVNKLDRERASFERTLDDLKAKFGAGVAPLELPIGEEGEFRGVIDLLSDEAETYAGRRRPRDERSAFPTPWRPRSTKSTTRWSRASWWPTTT